MMARFCIGVGADDTRWRCFLHHVFFPSTALGGGACRGVVAYLIWRGGFLLHFEGFCCCILRVFVLEEAGCKVGSGA